MCTPKNSSDLGSAPGAHSHEPSLGGVHIREVSQLRRRRIPFSADASCLSDRSRLERRHVGDYEVAIGSDGTRPQLWVDVGHGRKGRDSKRKAPESVLPYIERRQELPSPPFRFGCRTTLSNGCLRRSIHLAAQTRRQHRARARNCVGLYSRRQRCVGRGQQRRLG